jgi:hypothetical protein
MLLIEEGGLKVVSCCYCYCSEKMRLNADDNEKNERDNGPSYI